MIPCLSLSLTRKPKTLPLNMKNLVLFLAVTLALGASSLSAQTTPPAPADQNSPLRAWEASFIRGHYLVWLNAISSVSKHEYVADAAARVVEVNIATNSSVEARFYYLEAVTAENKSGVAGATQAILDRARQAASSVAERVAPGSSDMRVIKNYPASTHAHTIEFVLDDEEKLNSLYASLLQAVKTGRGRTWKEESEE